jgi:Mn2+/Fe2+ NRAMP family transporter
MPTPAHPVDDKRPVSPPTTLGGILQKLGPGLIIAASIVGSGELIGTTVTGAKAGISLLWLILLGCVVKVFAQIEIGRYTLTHGLPTLSSLNTVPGPKLAGRGNWLVWYWFVMWFCSIGQLGGIVGGVGQIAAISVPLTRQGQEYQAIGRLKSQVLIDRVSAEPGDAAPQQREQELFKQMAKYQDDYAGGALAAAGPLTLKSRLVEPWDDRLWATPVALITSVLLIMGRYGTIQAMATALVVMFTFITIGNVVRIETLPQWRLSLADFVQGMSFQLPDRGDRWAAITMALSTMGIIGVGASELVQYPYWCLEKGYARWTGRDDGSPEWIQRARGWMRVMHYDAWVSMVIYTLATIAFYILGVAILHRLKLVPEGSELVQMLAVMYKPVFSSWAPVIFLIGAFAVLYSTFYVANASHARTFTDGLVVVGLLRRDSRIERFWVQVLSGLFPLLCLFIYCLLPQPVFLVYLSGIAQAIMLPMLCFAALYFRYRGTHPGLRPGIFWDFGLWASSLVLAAVGGFSLYTNGMDVWKALFGGR